MFTAADLINNAQNEAAILNIFRANVVMSTYDPSQNFGAVYPMKVAQGWGVNPYVAKDAAGTVIDVMSIANMPAGGAATFPAYWCPYKSNDCKLAWLDSAADYMFTAKMDGCTFCAGSEAPSGARMVAHANLGGKGAEQLDLVKQQIAFANDPSIKYLGPASYRYSLPTGGTEATTFGIRLATGKWKFFSQIVLIDKIHKTMALMDVLPIG
jgi:hypothetical protein